MSVINRQESLLITAIDIINELGIQGLSTREVARRENMSNAAIFNHFKSKKDLILGVLNYYSKYDEAVIQTIKARGLKATEAIKYYTNTFYTYYENYPAITAISMAFNEFQYEAELSQSINNILKNRRAFMQLMVEEAQVLNQIRNDICSTSVTDIILGSSGEICLNWRMTGYSFSLKERVLSTLDVILISLKK